MKKRFLVPLLVLGSTNALCADESFDDFDDEFGDFYSDVDFVSIATGTKTSLDKAPAIASVITADDMRKRGVRNLTEALAVIPGLNVSRSSQIMAPKFNFRGITSTFSPQTLIMVNGTPLKSLVRGDSHVAWGEYPIHSIARIEIIRGPGSALYGADAFAGVINIISKGADDTSQNKFGASFGSFDSHSAWLNMAKSGSDYSVGLSIEYADSNGHDGEIKVDAQTALDEIANTVFGLPAVSLAPGHVNTSFESLDVFLKMQISELQFNIGLQERGDLGTGQGAADALDPTGRVGGQKLVVDLLHETGRLDSGLNIKSKLGYYRSSQNVEENLVLFPAGTFFGAFPDGLIGNPEWKEDNIHLNFTAVYSALKNHFISMGIGGARADLFEVIESKNFFSDISPRLKGIEDVSDTPEAFIPEASRNTGFIYLQDLWQISPDWELTAGIRWDYYSDIGSTINPRLALVWSTSLRSTTKFLYGRAFRAPSVAELLVMNNPVALGNPNLSPEVIDTYEIGYSIKPSPTVSFDINAFYYEINDFISFTPDEQATTSSAQNVGERNGYGLEFESTLVATEGVVFKANYSYVKADDRLLNDDVGDYPNHQMNIILDWNVSSHWHVNMLANVVGERQRTPNDSRAELEGFTNVSINLTYLNFNNGFEITISGKNVLNDEIFEPSGGPSSFGGSVNIPFDLPQAGASAYVSISKEF